MDNATEVERLQDIWSDQFQTFPSSPGVSSGDLLVYLPLVMKILAAFASGTGTFSTNTPRGKRWVRVQSEPFTD